MEIDIACATALDACRQGEASKNKKGETVIGGQRPLTPLVKRYTDFPQAWSPSTKWEDTGPLIDRFKPQMTHCEGMWSVTIVFYLYNEYRSLVTDSDPDLRQALAKCVARIAEVQ